MKINVDVDVTAAIKVVIILGWTVLAAYILGLSGDEWATLAILEAVLLMLTDLLKEGGTNGNTRI